MTEYFSFLQNVDFFIRLVVACLCGAAIGFERSRRFKGAGLRTHIIVCCGAALMMIVSKYSFVDLVDLLGGTYDGTKGADPSRIASQVVNGISFLGAGVIFKHGSSIRGLTTAAGVWTTAGIGLAIGAGMYPVAIFATVLVGGLQILMHRHTFGADAYITNRLQFTIERNENFPTALDEFLHKHKAHIIESKVTYDEHNGDATYEMIVRSPRDITMNEVNNFLQSVSAVRSVDYMAVS
ncbi:MAG: MgtC/SapB family protein [Clostridiaceae bacterium]|nr:MgtC/SapB family protein [Clostridiaceae bacterium]NBH78938.1 MgtC/SapB family protein [Clostridiaceae bacterium]NBI83018.1 MgtC/SapB family protein [Clostridiaceae bacterium]